MVNRAEFLEKYEVEKPIFFAWGDYLVNSIKSQLIVCGIDINTFLKIPVDVRIKENASIIAKAFFRKEKNYTNPYEQITDKVGTRFVVLELSEINIIKQIIEAHDIAPACLC